MTTLLEPAAEALQHGRIDAIVSTLEEAVLDQARAVARRLCVSGVHSSLMRGSARATQPASGMQDSHADNWSLLTMAHLHNRHWRVALHYQFCGQ